MKLMIVDDHAETRRLIRETVGHFATEIRECKNGEEAVRQCGEFEPDFVTMDLQMQPMDGLEATRRIVDARSKARIIVLTQLNLAPLRTAALRAGAICFILKDDLLELRRFFEQLMA